MSLNFLLIFFMIFIANKTREIEKNNNNYQSQISKINEKLKINNIELITHQNSSYLTKLHTLYFHGLKKSNIPNLISFDQLSNETKNIKLVNINN